MKKTIQTLALLSFATLALWGCASQPAAGTDTTAAAATTTAAPTAATTAAAGGDTAAAPAAGGTAAAAPTAPGELPAYTGGPASLRFAWWGNDERAGLTNQVIERFMAAYPDITVVGEPNGGTSDHFQIIDTQLQGNNAPDLIQFGGNWPDYKQYLLPLNDYVGKQLMVGSDEEFDQVALDTATADGNLYAVSLGTNTLVLAYNKSMIEAAGAELPKDNMTYEEMVAYGNSIKDKLPAGVYPFVDNSTNQANYVSYFSRQQGFPFWTADNGGTSYVDLATSQKWFQMWADMLAQGLIPDMDTTANYNESGPDTSLLVAGKAAIGLIWSNQLGAYQSAMTDTLGAITMPTGGKPACEIQMSQGLGVNVGTAYPEAAVLFVNYFVTSPEAGQILGTNRGVPSSPMVRDAIAPTSTPTDAAIYACYDAIADRTVPQAPNLPNDQEFVNELRLIGQNVGYGQITPDEAGQNFVDLVQRLIAK